MDACQYRITKAQLARLREALETFDVKEAEARIGSRILVKAELEAIKSEMDMLSAQLQKFEEPR